MGDLPSGDLLGLTAALIDIPSMSFNEGPITDALEAELKGLAHLETHRVGDNLVARTNRAAPAGSPWLAIPTPCRRPATTGPASTATPCGAWERPT